MTSEMVKREDVGLDVKVAESMVVRGDVSGLGPAQRQRPFAQQAAGLCVLCHARPGEGQEQQQGGQQPFQRRKATAPRHNTGCAWAPPLAS